MIDAPRVPLISVVTSTLNDRDGLLRTVNSLKSQTGTLDYEHIIVDGMSDYDVAGLLNDLDWSAALHQGRDDGLYDAMNRGTDCAQGRYLLYMNSGDTLAEPDTLAAISKALVEKEPDFLYGDSLERQLDGEIRLKPSRPIKRLPLGMITHHQAMLFRREVVEDIRLRYDLAYQIAADYDFVLRHVRASEIIHYLPQPICVFERGGTSFQKRNIARREQFHIRRAAYNSTLFAATIFAAQWGLRTFRGIFPSGYWALRKHLG